MEPKYNDENYQPDPFPEDVARPDVAPSGVEPGLPPELCETALLAAQMFALMDHAEHIEAQLVNIMARAYRWGITAGAYAGANRAMDELERRMRNPVKPEHDIGGEA